MLHYPRSRQEAGEAFAEEAIVQAGVFGQFPGDAAFGEDGGFVGVDGAEAEVEHFSDILGGVALDKGAQDFLLPFGEHSIDLPALEVVGGAQLADLLGDGLRRW